MATSWQMHRPAKQVSKTNDCRIIVLKRYHSNAVDLSKSHETWCFQCQVLKHVFEEIDKLNRLWSADQYLFERHSVLLNILLFICFLVKSRVWRLSLNTMQTLSTLDVSYYCFYFHKKRGKCLKWRIKVFTVRKEEMAQTLALFNFLALLCFLLTFVDFAHLFRVVMPLIYTVFF